MFMNNNNHSVFLLRYYLILPVKNTVSIDNEIYLILKSMFIRLSKKYNITLYEFQNNENYIYIYFDAHPNSELSKFINAYKSSSSRQIKKNKLISNNMLFEGFWQKSFLLITDGIFKTDTLKKYLEDVTNSNYKGDDA